MIGRVSRGRATLIAALALFSTDASAPPPLTLDEALRMFRASGFDLLVADAAIQSVRADVAIAGAVPNPSIGVARGKTSSYDPSLCAECSNQSISASVTDGAISDLVSGRHALRQAVAGAALEVSRRSRADVERTLEFTVEQQLLQAELAAKSLEFARDAEALAAQTVDLAQTRYRAGAISEADVARADVQRLEAEQSLDAGVASLNASKSQLAFLLGMKDARPETLDVADDLTRPAALDRLRAMTREALLENALQQRPDLAAARAQIARAQTSVDLAHRLRIPDFSPSLQYSQEGRGQNAIQPPTVTLGLSLPVPLFYRYRGEVARAEADLRTQEILRDKIEAQVNADVNASFASFFAARNRVERMRSELLPRAARARDLVRLQYEKGAASLFEFLDAQRTYLATQTEFLQTLNDYWTAVFALEQATGMELHQ